MAAQSFTSTQYKKRTLREVSIGYSSDLPVVANTSTIEYIALNSRGITLAPEIVTLVTQGTVQRYNDDEWRNVGITIDQDVWESVLAQIFMRVTSSGLTSDDGEGDYTPTVRYHGQGIPESQAVEVRLKITKVNIASGALRTEYIRFPKCLPRQFNPLASVAADAIMPNQVILEAQQSTTTIVGTAIDGAVSPGDFFFIDELS